MARRTAVQTLHTAIGAETAEIQLRLGGRGVDVFCVGADGSILYAGGDEIGMIARSQHRTRVIWRLWLASEPGSKSFTVPGGELYPLFGPKGDCGWRAKADGKSRDFPDIPAALRWLLTRLS